MEGKSLKIILLLFLDTTSTQFVGIRDYSEEYEGLKSFSTPNVGRGYEERKFQHLLDYDTGVENSKDKKTKEVITEVAGDRIGRNGINFEDNLIQHILNDPETIKNMSPEFNDEFYEMMDKLMPGVLDLLIPLSKTLKNIWPVLKEDPDIIQNMMPTLHEIIDSVTKKEKISQKMFARWGKKIIEVGGPHVKKWIKAIKESPTQNLASKIALLDFDHLEEYLKDNQLKTANDVVDWSKKTIGLLTDLADVEKPKSARGWYTGLFDKFESEYNGIDVDASTFDDDSNFLVMNDYAILKKLIPTSDDEFFDLMDKLIPGMKDLQQPLVKTLRNLWPIIKKDTDVMEKQMDTWKEIMEAILNDEKITDEEYAKWGKSLMKLSRPHIHNGIKAITESPVKELLEKVELLEFETIEELLEEQQQEVFKEVIAFCHAMIMLMADLGGVETKTNYMDWIKGIMDSIG